MLLDLLPVSWWLAFFQGEIQLLVARQVSVVGVVNVLGNSEHEWVIELIEGVVGELLVVLNTVTVQVGDPSSVPSLLLAGLRLQESQVLRSLDVLDEEGDLELVLRALLDVLKIAHVVRRLNLKIFLGQVLGSDLFLAEMSWWLWQGRFVNLVKNRKSLLWFRHLNWLLLLLFLWLWWSWSWGSWLLRCFNWFDGSSHWCNFFRFLIDIENLVGVRHEMAEFVIVVLLGIIPIVVLDGCG